MRQPFTKRLNFLPVIVALLLALAGCGSGNGRLLEESFEQLYTVEPNANITIQNGDGAVLVYGSNVNEMRVQAVKRAYQRARLKQIAIDVSTKPGSVSITTKFPPRSKWGLFDRSGTVDYTVVVPATANILGLDLDAGEVLVDGMRGQTTRARLGQGRMFARNCFTNLDLAIWRGNLILSYDWWEKSTFTAQANLTQGNEWAYLPVGGAFHLLAQAAHGEIFNDFETHPVGESAATRGTKVDALVNGGGEATIKLRVTEGNIKIVEARPQAK
ncbi:MAG: hypothetical protein WAN04_04260 [Candidatus Udaeobacter sp.]